MKHRSEYAEGKDIIMEDLREHCLYKSLNSTGDQQKWWDYMKYVHRMCYETVNEECSKMGHKSIGVEYEQTMQCVRDSFEGPNMQKDENKVLKTMAEGWKKYGTGYWPSIVINERTYRGDLVPDSVLNAICAGYNSMPQFCKKFEEELAEGQYSKSEGITGNVLIFVVVLLVLVNIVLIILYKKCTKKELKEDMQLQVNSAVSQYFALSTTNTSRM